MAPVSRREAVRSVHVAPQGKVVSGPAVTLGQPGAYHDIDPSVFWKIIELFFQSMNAII